MDFFHVNFGWEIRDFCLIGGENPKLVDCKVPVWLQVITANDAAVAENISLLGRNNTKQHNFERAYCTILYFSGHGP